MQKKSNTMIQYYNESFGPEFEKPKKCLYELYKTLVSEKINEEWFCDLLKTFDFFSAKMRLLFKASLPDKLLCFVDFVYLTKHII